MSATSRPNPAAGRPSNPSSSLPPFLRADGADVVLSVKLHPRAAVNAIGEGLGGELKIKVTAAPVDAAANAALIRLLAQKLGCPPRQIALIRGHTSRHKTLRLSGLGIPEVVDRLFK